jgi:hypothetical protein
MKEESPTKQTKQMVARVKDSRHTVERLAFLPPMMAGLIRIHHGSCHFTICGREHEENALKTGKPPIYTSWHFTFPAVIYHFRDRNGMVMVSRSRDGEWIARVLGGLGYRTARGSPGKGGGAALRQLIAHMKAGYSAGLIADGSQGPALVAQKGILILARHTQSPLVPVSMAAEPCWRFKSWDKTLLAKPFSRVAMAFGPPIWVGRDASSDELEVHRDHLEKTLNGLTEEARRALAAKPRVGIRACVDAG